MKRTLVVLAALTAVVAAYMLGYALIPVAAVAGAGGAGWWWVRRTHTRSTVTRWGARARRTSGVATTTEVLRRGSAVAMRRKATVVRPSLADLTARQRLMLPVTEFAVPLCRCGGLNVYSSTEDVVLVFGGPRMGKTQWLAGRVLDAAGACLVTSTRTDLLTLTGPLREATHGPIYVFNPSGLGDIKSTITFDPLTGCTDPVTANNRAADLLSATSTGGGGDREFWDAQARRVLAALLHAAALGDLGMRDVLGWVADPKASERQVKSLLRRSIEPAFVQDAAQFMTTNDRTQSSITSTIMPALGWLTSPTAAASADGTAHPFDVRQLLEERATVYLLGEEEGQVASLMTALTGYVAREARQLAATRPGGRLDPHLTLALDEAALISPVPLPSWTSDMGGRGVCIIAAFQSRAQMIRRYGDAGAAVVLNNAGAIMLFGNTKDRDDLDFWSKLAGERDEVVKTRDGGGKVTSKSVRKVAVLTPAQLANLPEGRAVVFRRSMSPAVGRVAMAWRRRDVRAHKRANARQHLATSPASLATGWAVSPAGVATPASSRQGVANAGR